MGSAASEAVPAIHELLSDPNPMTRLDAVEALRGLGPDAAVAVPDLVPMICGDERPLRREAYKTLRALDPEAAKRGRAAALADERAELREYTINAIREAGEVELYSAQLRQALKDPDRTVRWAAEKALGQSDGP